MEGDGGGFPVARDGISGGVYEFPVAGIQLVEGLGLGLEQREVVVGNG